MEEEDRRFRLWLIKKAWFALKARKEQERLANERIVEHFISHRRPSIVRVYRLTEKGKHRIHGGHRIIRKYIEEDVTTVHPEEA
jgi:hypothetical protein